MGNEERKTSFGLLGLIYVLNIGIESLFILNPLTDMLTEVIAGSVDLEIEIAFMAMDRWVEK